MLVCWGDTSDAGASETVARMKGMVQVLAISEWARLPNGIFHYSLFTFRYSFPPFLPLSPI